MFICDSIIKGVKGREVLDSRGNPTVEAEVVLATGETFRGIVPSGASTGEYEALELRDNNPQRYCGKGVTHAVNNINNVISELLSGMSVTDIYKIDEAMIKCDGTKDKSNLGANAVLAVSIACVYAGAHVCRQPVYRYIGGFSGRKLPVPMLNVINGGAHASNNIDIQEFMLVPMNAPSFKEALRHSVEVYKKLQEIIKKQGYSAGVGDEGGFAPNLKEDSEAIEMILAAVEMAGYKCPDDFMISLDVAASEWVQGDSYVMPKRNVKFSTGELIKNWVNLCARYPIFSIEDPLGENDWNGWQKLTGDLEAVGIYGIIGDDLFVTNSERLKKGIKMKAGNGILIKPNQIGTVTETVDAIRFARANGFKTIVSHRSGETEDTFIADLAVGMNTGFIKTGATCRGERVAKFNRLLRIEEMLD
ncbi:MAG: phosphopyruvate hydratase [Clostridia bacterium]|nr:phosphopyruvate hydratase [Clostridia bacterium]